MPGTASLIAPLYHRVLLMHCEHKVPTIRKKVNSFYVAITRVQFQHADLEACLVISRKEKVQKCIMMDLLTLIKH